MIAKQFQKYMTHLKKKTKLKTCQGRLWKDNQMQRFNIGRDQRAHMARKESI